MVAHDLLPLVPLVGLLGVAAAIDARSRRIPNWLTFGLILSGLAHAMAPLGAGIVLALGGLFAGAAIPLMLFGIGALGGGDVKLLAGVGAWLGPWPALCVFAITALLGMIIVLAQCAAAGRMKLLFRNSAVVGINLVHLKDLGVDHARETAERCRTIERPLPYAVPVLLAALVVLALHGRVLL